MADRDDLSADALVRRVLTDEHADLVREAVSFLCHQILEAEPASSTPWTASRMRAGGTSRATDPTYPSATGR